jgi:hypothetical protein
VKTSELIQRLSTNIIVKVQAPLSENAKKHGYQVAI